MTDISPPAAGSPSRRELATADSVEHARRGSGLEPAGAPTGPAHVVAAFDLDGTLTSGHSLVDIAVRLVGWRGFARAVVAAAGRSGFPPRRGAYKDALFERVLAGRSASDVRRVGALLARDLVEERLREETAAELRAHQAAGHEVVLVTAALDVYVEPVARLLGIDGVISTRVEVVGGRCTGRLLDSALHDERKVELLRAWLGPRVATTEVHAYGNSEDDDELQRFAESTRRHAGARGVSTT